MWEGGLRRLESRVRMGCINVRACSVSRTGPGPLRYWTVARQRRLALATRPKYKVNYRVSDIATESSRQYCIVTIEINSIHLNFPSSGTLRWTRRRQ